MSVNNSRKKKKNSPWVTEKGEGEDGGWDSSSRSRINFFKTVIAASAHYSIDKIIRIFFIFYINYLIRLIPLLPMGTGCTRRSTESAKDGRKSGVAVVG